MPSAKSTADSARSKTSLIPRRKLLGAAPDESVKKQAQHNRRRKHVQPIALNDERPECEGHASYRGGDEQHQPELYDRPAVTIQGFPNYPAHATQRGAFPAELLEVCGQMTVLSEQKHSTNDDHDGRGQYADLEQTTNDLFHSLIPAVAQRVLRLSSRCRQSPPLKPL
jgi:hypothetical protein